MTKQTSALRFGVVAVAVLFSLTVLGADRIFENAEVHEFERVSYTYPLSPFKVKQARKKGIKLEPKVEPSIPLMGFLAEPEGNGSFPVVVLMHTCAGITEHEESWSDRLVAWDYMVLTVDSFTPRDEKYTCGQGIITPWAWVLAAFRAKRYLSSRPFVVPNRIAVMGISRGANAVLLVIKQSTTTNLHMSPFRAAVAFYP